VYDNIEYTKKGWINRNRILVNGKDEFISLPLKKDSDFLHVNQRYLAESFDAEKTKTLRKIAAAYRKAPYFEETYALLERIYHYPEKNLFNFIFNSLKEVCAYLDICSELVLSSSVAIDHSLKAEQKVIEICKALGATRYINPIGGLELYSNTEFSKNGLELQFLKSSASSYQQFNNEFIPWLSILDVIMFNSKEDIKNKLSTEFTLVSN